MSSPRRSIATNNGTGPQMSSPRRSIAFNDGTESPMSPRKSINTNNGTEPQMSSPRRSIRPSSADAAKTDLAPGETMPPMPSSVDATARSASVEDVADRSRQRRLKTTPNTHREFFRILRHLADTQAARFRPDYCKESWKNGLWQQGRDVPRPRIKAHHYWAEGFSVAEPWPSNGIIELSRRGGGSKAHAFAVRNHARAFAHDCGGGSPFVELRMHHLQDHHFKGRAGAKREEPNLRHEGKLIGPRWVDWRKVANPCYPDGCVPAAGQRVGLRKHSALPAQSVAAIAFGRPKLA